MRKLFLILTVVFLFQSCYSYKAMDNNPSKMIEGKRYKIERNHKNYKVTFNRLTDSSIFVTRKNFMKEEIPITDITTIKKENSL
ncbi:MAG: hypothetical protein M0D53_07885 [Flavobacterium sp. JAD_PAG50586_2]|nr:MAG: hypothetical protein M0D53_07885 [Flavobacterium sp. JAD_PAG50586_2]